MRRSFSSPLRIDDLTRRYGTEEQKAELEAERQAQLALDPITYTAPSDYPTGEKMVLLELRPDNELARKVLTSLRAMSAEPTYVDRAMQIDRRNVTRDKQGRLHLTPMGLHAAQTIARALGKNLQLHAIEISGGRGSGHIAICCCGWRSSLKYGSDTGRRNAEGAGAEHVKNPQAFEPMIAVIDRVLAAQARTVGREF